MKFIATVITIMGYLYAPLVGAETLQFDDTVYLLGMGSPDAGVNLEESHILILGENLHATIKCNNLSHGVLSIYEGPLFNNVNSPNFKITIQKDLCKPLDKTFIDLVKHSPLKSYDLKVVTKFNNLASVRINDVELYNLPKQHQEETAQ